MPFTLPSISLPRRTRYLILAVALLILFSGTYHQYYTGDNTPYWAPNYISCSTRLTREGIPPTPPAYLNRLSLPSPSALSQGAQIVSGKTLMSLKERLASHSIDISGGELSSDPNELYLLDRLTRSLIIHQSWKSPNASTYPLFYAAHSHLIWQASHPGWLYVLWSDEENAELVRGFYPEWWDVYKGMAKGIMKADFVRNLYMHGFGGVYADLDVVPLERTDLHLPFAYVPAAPDSNQNSNSNSSSSPSSTPEPAPASLIFSPTPNDPPKVYLAKMHPSTSPHGPPEAQSIPNAWFATTAPAHPFWLRVAQRSIHLVQTSVGSSGKWVPPEVVTGPEPLWWAVGRWRSAGLVSDASAIASSPKGSPNSNSNNEKDKDKDSTNSKQNSNSNPKEAHPVPPTNHENTNANANANPDIKQATHPNLFILSPERIFPYSWAEARRVEHCLCSPRYPNTFDPDRCASLYPDAWALSFWGSSWSPWSASEPATTQKR